MTEEEPLPMYDESELLPVKRKEKERIIYYHECISMKCNVIKDNKEPCRFCGTEDWKIYRIL